MRLVLDASLTLAWHFEDEASVEADRLLYAVTRGGAVVPSLWRIEVASGFQSAIRRKRIDQRYRDDSLADLRLLPIEIDGEGDVWWSTPPLADAARDARPPPTFCERALGSAGDADLTVRNRAI